MCDLDHDGYGQKLHDAVRVARKPYRCVDCDRRIEPGQPYGYYFGKWEGDTFDARFCMRCNKARKWLESRGHGWLAGGDAGDGGNAGGIAADVRYCAEVDRAEIIAAAKAKRGANARGGE